MNKITPPLKPQSKGLKVAHLHEALVLLGFNIGDAETNNRRFGASTRAAVIQFQNTHKLPATGAVDERTAKAINKELTDNGPLDPGVPDGPDPIPVPAGRRVVGTVLHADGSAISGMLVRAFHRRVGSEVPLDAEVATNDRGKYTITYLLPGGISKIDLFVRAYDNQTIVAVSPIIIGAGAQAVLDLSVTDPKFRGPSEYARTSEALAPKVADAKLDALDADDVALLVRNTGITRESVTAWIAARRLAERTGVEPESLYGLVRTENTAALPRLLRRSATRLLRSLTGAAESNLISHAAGQRADATVTRLRQLAVELSISHKTPGSLGKLLATCIRATPAQQTGFIARYADHEGPVQALWKTLRKDPGFGDAVVGDLQLSLQLGTLAANHPPMVQALRSSGVVGGLVEFGVGLANLGAKASNTGKIWHVSWDPKIALENTVTTPGLYVLSGHGNAGTFTLVASWRVQQGAPLVMWANREHFLFATCLTASDAAAMQRLANTTNKTVGGFEHLTSFDEGTDFLTANKWLSREVPELAEGGGHVTVAPVWFVPDQQAAQYYQMLRVGGYGMQQSEHVKDLVE